MTGGRYNVPLQPKTIYIGSSCRFSLNSISHLSYRILCILVDSCIIELDMYLNSGELGGY